MTRIKRILLLTGLAILVLVACAPRNADEPTTEPTDGSGGGDVVTGMATITGVEVGFMESWPLQAAARVTGEVPDGCTEPQQATVKRDGNRFLVTIETMRPADAVCTEAIETFEQSVHLDIRDLPAGTYTVDVNGFETQFTLEQDNVIPTEPANGLSRSDEAELIRAALHRALVLEEIPDYALLANQETIILSTANIDAELVPALSNVALTLMTPEEIQARADEMGDFPYLQFEAFSVEKSDRVRVSLGSRWAVGGDSEMGYLSGGGFEILYERTGNGWTGEITSAWIS
jgi:inhibitor of cysteine peptidase